MVGSFVATSEVAEGLALTIERAELRTDERDERERTRGAAALTERVRAVRFPRVWEAIFVP